MISRKKKEKLYHKKCKEPTYTNFEVFKEFNKIYIRLCRLAKINYYQAKIEAAGNDMRINWNIIKEAIGTPKKCTSLPGYFKSKDKKIRGDKEIAEGFNDFFSSIGKNLMKLWKLVMSVIWIS